MVQIIPSLQNVTQTDTFTSPSLQSVRGAQTAYRIYVGELRPGVMLMAYCCSTSALHDLITFRMRGPASSKLLSLALRH